MTATCDFCGKAMPCPMFYAGKMCCPTCWDAIRKGINRKKKEAPTMNVLKVEYNGFTGELVKLERTTYGTPSTSKDTTYGLVIYNSELGGTFSASGVKLEDVKFLGGAVIFGE